MTGLRLVKAVAAVALAAFLVVAVLAASQAAGILPKPAARDRAAVASRSTQLSPKPSHSLSPPATATPTPVAVPKYSVLTTTTTDRFDKAPTVYVLVAPVDVSTNAFKGSIKALISDLARKSGTSNFSASIYDDAATAVSDYSHELPSGAADYRAKAAAKAPHLIAMYSGGIDLETAKQSTADSAYYISFYPAADQSTPVVGKYVDGFSRFKP